MLLKVLNIFSNINLDKATVSLNQKQRYTRTRCKYTHTCHLNSNITQCARPGLQEKNPCGMLMLIWMQRERLVLTFNTISELLVLLSLNVQVLGL